jgi:hypothetical protein
MTATEGQLENKMTATEGQLLTGVFSFVREKNGKISSSRILFLLWGGGVFGVWCFLSIANRTIEPIPESVVTFLGIMAGSKVVQRIGENMDKN